MRDTCKDCVYYTNGICATNGAPVAATKDYCFDYINKANADHEFNELKEAAAADFYCDYYLDFSDWDN